MTSRVPATTVFRAIADPTRRAILDLLMEGEKAGWELLRSFSISQPALSKHLRILREAGLVLQRKVGRERLHRIEGGRLKTVADWVAHFQRFWTEKLDALDAYLDEDE